MPSEVRFCESCKWSYPREDSSWDLRCSNPYVNAKDPWALAVPKFQGRTECRGERAKGYFAPCGMRGKLWEPK